MSEPIVEIESSLADALKMPEIKPVVKFILSRRLKPEIHHLLIEQVVATMDDDPDALKTALLYLEANDWCDTSAIVQIDLDKSNAQAYTAGNTVDRNNENPKLDRSLVKPGKSFKNDALTLELTIDGHHRTFEYRKSPKVDPNIPDDIIDLNLWRHAKILHYVGLPRTNVPSGEHWHPLQETFLIQRYAAQNVDKRGVQYDKITDELNNLFTGLLLPGRYKPCEPRTQNAVVSLLTRKVINPRTKSRRWPEKMSTIDKHHAAQKRVREERKELMDWNLERDVDRLGGGREVVDSEDED